MDESRVKQIYTQSTKCWQFYKKWSETPPNERDDTYWEQVNEDIKARVKGEKDCPDVCKDLLLVYAGELQREFKERKR